MGIRERIAALIAPEVKAPKQQPMIGSVGLQQPNIPIYTDMTVRKAVREGYKISIYVYRAVRTIVQSASGIPWVVLDRKGEPIEEHDLTYRLQHPNPFMSGQDLMELLIAHLLLPGNALWQPIIAGNKIIELWPIMPDHVKPIPGATADEWLKAWQVSDSEGKQEFVAPETFIHFQQFDPGNPYWGIGPLMAAARTVDTDNEAVDTQKISMQNRAMPDGVFALESILTPEQFEEATRQVKEQRINKLNRRAPWVLGAGAKWQQMSLTPVEMDYIASRLANKRDIAAAFGISPIFLGDLEQSSYNNMQEARKALYEDAIIPMLDDIKATLNLQVAPIYGDISIIYDLSGVAALRDDYGKKVDSAQKLWGMGVPFEQINEVLEMGLEEFTGWDSSYLPFSVMPVEALGQARTMPGTEPEEDQGQKTINLHTEEQKAAHWKKVDARKQAYWAVVARKLKPLYQAEADAVVQAGTDISAVKKAINSQKSKWAKTLTAVHRVLIEDFGNEAARDIQGKSVKIRFDPFSEGVRKWISNHVTENVTTILGTNLDSVKSIIQVGIADNLNTTDIARNLRTFYDENAVYNAMRVARTEVTAGASEGQLECLKQFGIKKKTWLSSRDDRVRDSHQHMDGETKALSERFSNGCMAPGQCDSAAEAIQCRCDLLGEV